MAAGVPKPATPSRKAPKVQLMTMSWTRGSGDMAANPSRIRAIASPSVRSLKRSIAPKMIHKTEAAIAKPSIEAARIVRGAMCHRK